MISVASLAWCRHLRRPSFDIGLLFNQIVRSRAVVNLIDSDNCLSKFCTTVKLSSNNKIVIRGVNAQFFSTTMALNKLSIDKVDLAGKRVLIRYVSHHSINLRFFFIIFYEKYFDYCQIQSRFQRSVERRKNNE